MIYSTAEIESMVNKYRQAEQELLEGKTVTWNGRTMTMENLSDIREGRKEWETRLINRKNGRNSRQPALSRFN